MTSRWREPLIVADASPLIGLAKIGRLELLHLLAEEVWVPRAVWIEVVERDVTRAEIPLLQATLTTCVREPEAGRVAAFRSQVDEGEAAALALAEERPEALLLMDDLQGRRVAQRHGFRYFGTLGFLLRAKREGLIDSLKVEIEALLKQGLFLDDAIVRQVLRTAGEEP